MVEKYDHHLAIYISFWFALSFFGYLFIEFYRMKNSVQLSRIMELLHYGLIYPAFFLYLILFSWMLAVFSSYQLFYVIVFMGGVPFLSFMIPHWWSKFKPCIIKHK